MIPTSNHTICDLSKVQYATFVYKNQYDQWSRLKPKFPTYRLMPVAGNLMNGKSMLDFVTEERLTDRWTPTLSLQFAANHSLTYTGERAVAMWAEWRARIFGKNKKKH